MDNKGFAISFSWLFAVMAGIIIFLFFGYFAVQQTDLFGKISAQVAAEELDITFTNIKSSLSSTRLDFGKKVDLNFDCVNELGPGRIEKMYINGKGGKTLKGKIVFSPKEMSSSSFNVWTLDWNVPFKVTNFIFLNDGRKYNFNVMNLNQNLLRKIPEEFRNGVGTGGLDTGCSTINYDVDLKEHYGTLCVTINGQSKDYSFFGDALLVASVFSSPGEFECLYELSKSKMNIMKKLYVNKLDVMRNTGCITYDIESDLNGLSIDDQTDIPSSILTVDEENNKLLRSDCGRPLY